jgi:D-alanyl-D-alanine carboxypeptidase
VPFVSRNRDDLIFPILNTSQNWFAEMLLKTLGRHFGAAGSWDEGLAVERRFLIDSAGIDSAAFSLSDGSGLSASNLVAPRAFAHLLRYVWTHPQRAGFLRGLRAPVAGLAAHAVRAPRWKAASWPRPAASAT